VPEQQLHESYKCIECVEALNPDTSHHLARLRQRSVAQVHAHLSTQAEESCYQVVRLENAL